MHGYGGHASIRGRLGGRWRGGCVSARLVLVVFGVLISFLLCFQGYVTLMTTCVLLYGVASSLLIFFGPKIRQIIAETQAEKSVVGLKKGMFACASLSHMCLLAATWFQLREKLLKRQKKRKCLVVAWSLTVCAPGTQISERQVTQEQQAIRKLLKDVRICFAVLIHFVYSYICVVDRRY